MAAVAPLIIGQYNPLSDLLCTVTGAVDGAGVPLTNLNATAAITVTSGSFGGTAVVTAQAMSYAGGVWTATVPAADLPRGLLLYGLAQFYDLSSVLHLTLPAQLSPVY